MTYTARKNNHHPPLQSLAFQRFSRLAIKPAEHTWGED